MVGLLKLITSEPWWSRAWTFWEEYKATINMKLLIPHIPAFEGCKRRRASGILGTLAGELCVDSADFRVESTRFCLAYQGRIGAK